MKTIIRAAMICLLFAPFVNAQTCTSNFGGNPLFGSANGLDDIGRGTDGTLAAIGVNGVGIQPGNGWLGKSLPLFPGDGTTGRIAVGPDGTLLVSDSSRNIWKVTPGASSWTQLTGLAKDVAITSDGTLWVVGTLTAGSNGDFHIYYYNGCSWVQVSGAATRITGGPDNQPWVVNASGNIYHRNNDGSWGAWTGLGQDIGVDGSDSPWVIGSSDVLVWHWNNGQWVCDPNASLGSNKQNGQNASITGGPGASAFYIDAGFPPDIRSPVQQ